MNVWGINPEILTQHAASVAQRIQQLQEVSQKAEGSLSPWEPITNPLEIVHIQGSDAHINVQGVVLQGSSAMRFLISEGYYNDPKLVSDAIKILNENVLIERIILHLDTPGGNVSGCYEVGMTIENSPKSIIASVANLCCSAGFWYAGAADKIEASRMDQIGSIGTMIQLVDSSKFYESMGLSFKVVSTGSLKGAFAEGTEITQAQLDYAQELVDGINKIFLEFLLSNRPSMQANMTTISTGKVFLAEEAQSLGLIDSIISYNKPTKQKEKNFMDFQALLATLTPEQKAAFENEKKSAAAEAEARAAKAEQALKDAEITARANKYAEEAKSFGNLPGIEASAIAGILAASDDAKIGDDIRKLLSSCTKLVATSPVLKTVGSSTSEPTAKEDSRIALDTKDEAYLKLHSKALEIAEKENISYGIAFLRATKSK